MWPYLGILACTVASDSVPVVGLPAWTIMVLFWTAYDLNPWLVLVVGVSGCTAGRLVFSLYAAKLSERFIKRGKNAELAFVGRKLDRSLWRSWLFVFVYALTPLSTTALFLAVGIGDVRLRQVLPPFFAGKFVIDAILMFSGGFVVSSVSDLFQGTFSWKGLGFTIGGVAFVALLLFLDWRALLEHRKLRFAFRIWKSR